MRFQNLLEGTGSVFSHFLFSCCCLYGFSFVFSFSDPFPSSNLFRISKDIPVSEKMCFDSLPFKECVHGQ